MTSLYFTSKWHYPNHVPLATYPCHVPLPRTPVTCPRHVHLPRTSATYPCHVHLPRTSATYPCHVPPPRTPATYPCYAWLHIWPFLVRATVCIYMLGVNAKKLSKDEVFTRWTRAFLIPWTGVAFAPLRPFLCPTTEEKKWPIAPKPGP